MCKVKYITKSFCDIFTIGIRDDRIASISIIYVCTYRVDTCHKKLILTTSRLGKGSEYIWLVATVDPCRRCKYTLYSSFSICLIEAWISQVKTYR